MREQVSLLLHGLIEIAIQFGEGVVGDDGLRLLVRFVLECLLWRFCLWHWVLLELLVLKLLILAKCWL